MTSNNDISSTKCREFYEAVADAKTLISRNTELSAYYRMHLRQEWQVLARIVGNGEGRRILDIGCGPAYILDEAIAGDGFVYVGLDIALKAIPRGRNSDDVHFALGNAESLPFASSSFDVVIASHLIEHLHSSDRFISECCRILKTKGMLIVTTPSDSSILKNRFIAKSAFVLGVAIGFCLSMVAPRDFITKLQDFSSARRAGMGAEQTHSQEEHVHEFKPEELEGKLRGSGLRIVQTRFSGLHVFRHSLVLSDPFGRLVYRITSKVESWQSAELRRIAYDMTYVAVKEQVIH